MEAFEYFIDGEKIAKDEFDELLLEAAEYLAKEDGIYYEWLNYNLPQNEYDEFIDNTFIKWLEELNETGKLYINHIFEKRKI